MGFAEDLAADVAAEHEQEQQAAVAAVEPDAGPPSPDASGQVKDAPPPASLADVFTAARAFLELVDVGHLVVVAATAVTATAAADEPVWLLLVAPPSSGKTEAVRALDRLVFRRMDEVTAAGLLSWRKVGAGKAAHAKPAGLLVEMGPLGMISIGDLSVLLESGDRTGRSEVFALLRRASDGSVDRTIHPPALPVGTLAWSGRLTMVGAVTGAIDRFGAWSQALGPRWLQYRLPPQAVADRRASGRKARAAEQAKGRRWLAEVVERAVRTARPAFGAGVLSEAVADAVEDAALVTCWGRASVPRNGYGRREIDGVPEVEEPTRLVRALTVLGRGMVVLGVDEPNTAALLRRVALDCIPAERRAVLGVLSAARRAAAALPDVDVDGTHAAAELSTSETARRSGLHPEVARRALEELAALTGEDRVVTARRDGGDDLAELEVADRRTKWWRLADTVGGELVAAVFALPTAYVEGPTKCG